VFFECETFLLNARWWVRERECVGGGGALKGGHYKGELRVISFFPLKTGCSVSAKHYCSVHGGGKRVCGDLKWGYLKGEMQFIVSFSQH